MRTARKTFQFPTSFPDQAMKRFSLSLSGSGVAVGESEGEDDDCAWRALASFIRKHLCMCVGKSDGAKIIKIIHILEGIE